MAASRIINIMAILCFVVAVAFAIAWKLYEPESGDRPFAYLEYYTLFFRGIIWSTIWGLASLCFLVAIEFRKTERSRPLSRAVMLMACFFVIQGPYMAMMSRVGSE
jgi:hypothetical protein